MFGNNSFFGNTSNASFSGATPFGGTSFTAPSMGAFGSTTQNQPVGTTIKFSPVTGTDSVQKAGTTGGPSQITTRHQNISAMKEYENKSNDELRLADYEANRKVGQPQSAFGSTPTSSLGTIGSTNLFGAPQSQASAFGNQTSAFGNSSTTGFGGQTQPATNLFGAPQTQTSAFGNQTSAFGSPSQSTTTLGAQNQSTTGFGNQAQPTSNLFGTPQNQSNNIFGQPKPAATQSSFPLFNSQPSAPFGSTTESPFKTNPFSTPNPTQPANSIFNTNKTNTSSSSFFGLNTTNTPTQSAPFGTTSGAFGSTSLFNTSIQQKPAFETNNNSNSGLFGTNTSGGLFSGGLNKPATATTQASTGFGPGTSGGMYATKPATGFGSQTQPTSNLFGTPQNQTNNIFGQPKPAATQSSFPLFNSQPSAPSAPFGSTTESPFKANPFSTPNPPQPASSIFSTNKTNTSSNGFFGLNTTNTPTQSAPFGSTNGAFGSNSLFNTSIQQKPAFETNNNSNSGIFSGFGGSPFSGGLTNPTMTNQTQTTAPTQDSSIKTSSELLLDRLKTLPYGDNFLQDTSSSFKFTTDPKTVNQYRISAKTVESKKPPEKHRPKVNSVLFDGLIEKPVDDLRCALDMFIPKNSVKKLIIEPNLANISSSSSP